MAVAPALLGLALASVFFWWIYYRREFSVPSRPVLLGARLLSLLGLAVLFWNPSIPWGQGSALPRFVILDASTSMAAATESGSSLWEVGVARAGALADESGYRILLSGGAPTAVDVSELGAVQPHHSSSTLTEALGVAAEAGASDVVVLTDRRIADPLAAAGLAERLEMQVAVDTLPPSAPNLGIARFDLPGTGEGGTAVQGRVEVQGSSASDSVTLVIGVDGSVVQTLRLAAPQGDGISAATLQLPSTLSAGARVVDVALEGGDAFPGDDRRVRVLQIDPEETGVLLVSFLPGWEARFLFPVLEQVTGLPVQGYMKIGADRYLSLSGDSPGEVNEAGLVRRMQRAELVVAMGVDGSTRELVDRGVARTRRMLLFPADAAGALVGGVTVGPPLAGEWYVDEPPASPVAGALGDFELSELPPLNRVFPLLDEGGGTALAVRLGGAGRPEAALVLRSQGGRRVAVALAQGFWRWGFRDGAPKERYRRLWSAVGGWMLADEPLAAGPGVRPFEAVLPRSVPTTWQGRGYEGDSVRITVADSVGTEHIDTVLAVPSAGRFEGPSLPPGRYTFVSLIDADTTSGTFVVEDYSGDMLHRPVDAGVLSTRGVGGEGVGRGTRPLRTSPIPYLLILGTLCGEWIGRRRAGLR